LTLGENARIVATGGASSNLAILQVLADVFNSPVYTLVSFQKEVLILIMLYYLLSQMGCGSSVSIAARSRMDDRGVGFLCIVQTGSRAHLDSYPMGTGGLLPRG
jgi:hypothetical protein